MTGKTNPDDATRGRDVSPGLPELKARDPGEGEGDQAGPPRSATGKSQPEALSVLEGENAELKDRLLRALAEVENTRSRAERDANDMRQYAIAKFAGDMLSVADNLQRAIANVTAKARHSDEAVRTLIDGVELTEREMLLALQKHGIKKLNPIGQHFDPNFHEAMFEVPNTTAPRGTVVRVVEPGYSIGSRVLRPAKVAVAGAGSPSHTTPRA